MDGIRSLRTQFGIQPRHLLPRVRIAAPIRNRGWILGRYLEALGAIDYPSDLLSFHFLLNDCTDNTEDLIIRWAGSCPSPVIVTVRDFSRTEEDSRVYSVRQKTYEILAALREDIFESARRDAVPCLFCVDSDIIIPPETLKKLLSANRDVVAAVIKNGPGNIYNFLHRDQIGYARKDEYPKPYVFEVDVTGACCLYSKSAIDSGKWSFHPSGEDIAFCESLDANKIRRFVDGTTWATHDMKKEEPR